MRESRTRVRNARIALIRVRNMGIEAVRARNSGIAVTQQIINATNPKQGEKKTQQTLNIKTINPQNHLRKKPLSPKTLNTKIS